MFQQNAAQSRLTQENCFLTTAAEEYDDTARRQRKDTTCCLFLILFQDVEEVRLTLVHIFGFSQVRDNL